MLHECDSRTNDGITVTLWWEDKTGVTCVSVDIPRSDFWGSFEVSHAEARDTFYHPFVYLPLNEILEAEELVSA